MKCKSCGAESSGRYCDYCGSELPTRESNAVNNTTIINNFNVEPAKTILPNNTLNPTTAGRYQKNKWIAFFLCMFTFCGHKFYEGKVGMGVLYFLTLGFFGIGWIIDMIVLLTKPNPYFV